MVVVTAHGHSAGQRPALPTCASIRVPPASGLHYRPARRSAFCRPAAGATDLRVDPHSAGQRPALPARRSAFRRPAAGTTDLRVDPHSAGQRPALPTCASIRVPPASGRHYRLRVDPISSGQRPALPTCASIRILPASGRLRVDPHSAGQRPALPEDGRVVPAAGRHPPPGSPAPYALDCWSFCLSFRRLMSEHTPASPETPPTATRSAISSARSCARTWPVESIRRSRPASRPSRTATCTSATPSRSA